MTKLNFHSGSSLCIAPSDENADVVERSCSRVMRHRLVAGLKAILVCLGGEVAPHSRRGAASAKLGATNANGEVLGYFHRQVRGLLETDSWNDGTKLIAGRVHRRHVVFDCTRGWSRLHGREPLVHFDEGFQRGRKTIHRDIQASCGNAAPGRGRFVLPSPIACCNPDRCDCCGGAPNGPRSSPKKTSIYRAQQWPLHCGDRDATRDKSASQRANHCATEKPIHEYYLVR